MDDFNFEDYFVGSDVLGAESSPGPFLTIHVKNVPELVAKQGGGVGNLALSLLPQTVENKVYSEMASQFSQKLKEQGVVADVKVVNNRPAVSPLSQDFTVGALLGAGGVGIGYGIVKLVQHFFGSRK